MADDAQRLGISYRRIGGVNWLPGADEEPSDELQLLMDYDAGKDGQTIVFKTKYFQIRAIPDEKSLASGS